MINRCDIAIVGCGAAGLFAAVWAGRAAREAREAGSRVSIVGFDGAKRLGAKILVAGGGRCNVTHHAVDEKDYFGGSRNAIRKVLRTFGVNDTVAFFRELGVHLKREDTGKLFPTTDDAHTVLDAILAAVRDVGAKVEYPARVQSVLRDPEGGFALTVTGGDGTAARTVRARRVIIATGGQALPRSGSDGAGYGFVRRLGHTITPRVFPSLAPLTIDKSHPLCGLSGVTVPALLELRSGTGKRLDTVTDSLLLTHFGLSGPAALNMSRRWTAAKGDDAGAAIVINWLTGTRGEDVDRLLLDSRPMGLLRWLIEIPPQAAGVPGHDVKAGVPERLARHLCEAAAVDPATQVKALTRDQRRAIVRLLTEYPVPVTGDRGFTYAEATAGGVPLSEVHLDTMESRVVPGLYLCGEILDVDGRIGGFNFQWAWATGFIAGKAAAAAAADKSAGGGAITDPDTLRA